MVVPASPRTQDATAAAKAVFAQVKQASAIGMFCSNEGTVVGVLAATNDGADLATTCKSLLLGSVTQDPYLQGRRACVQGLQRRDRRQPGHRRRSKA